MGLQSASRFVFANTTSIPLTTNPETVHRASCSPSQSI